MQKQLRGSAMLVALGLILAVACGDKDEKSASDAGTTSTEGDGGGNGGNGSNVGDKASETITAADGGSIALTDAGVTLDIPAGALGKDTKISAEVLSTEGLPDSKSLNGDAIEFLPNGLTFEKPVALTIDLHGVEVPSDAKATISWLDTKTNKWVDLEGATVADGKVTAETTHFTVFAVRFVVDDDGNVTQTEGQCGGDFDACGGKPEGTWKIVTGCVDVPAAVLAEATKACPGSTFSFGLDVVGDITLEDGTISAMLETTSEEIAVRALTCVDSCENNQQDEPETVFTVMGDNCESKKTKMESKTLDGTYEVGAGGKITIVDAAKADAGDEMIERTYCVDEAKGTLRISTTDKNGVRYEWTAERQ